MLKKIKTEYAKQITKYYELGVKTSLPSTQEGTTTMQRNVLA